MNIQIKQTGFTLVEILVVIAILGVIMAYAIPSYQRNVIISKRTIATKAILQIAAAQERNNATYNQYATTMATNAGATSTDLGLSGAEFSTSVDYSFTLGAGAGYTIIATAIGHTQINDNFGVDCTSLTLNALGQKTPLDCWQ